MTAEDKDVMIREFKQGDEKIFRELNEEWIARYFEIEAADEETLADPWGKVIDRGGRILLAFVGERGVGCCALVAMGPGEFEVAKMAVTEEYKGQGIGSRLIEATIEKARELGATRLYLETNHTLTPALRLYRAHGFRDVPAERVAKSAYARADVAMELAL